MTRHTRTLFAALLAIAIGCGGKTTAPTIASTTHDEATTAAAGAAATASASDADRVLGIDSRIRVGKLDNGLTYYILVHHKPEQRAQLRLAVNAGSVLEDEDQRGLAHFVEHMAFNGTEKFHKMAIVDYLEGIGMKFGPDVNAYTSFDETVYMLQVPTDDSEIVDKGFEILRQWAGAVSFDPDEVEKERGVVLEEWRLGRGAFKRILDKQYPVLFHGSRYAERLPIGSDEIIKGAPRDVLVRFYRDWYRPDLMAVVAVGDFDPDVIEQTIKTKFGDLKGPAEPRPRAEVQVPPHAGTLVTVETDPEMPQTSVQIYNKMPHRPERTVADYRRFVVEQIYQSMFNGRLDEIRERPDSPFVYAFSYTGDVLRTTDAYVRMAMAKEGEVEQALRLLFREVLRVERHGFTEGELARAKKQVRRQYQQLEVERDKSHGEMFAAEIIRNYLEGEMMPGIDEELELVERFLPTVTLDELNELARSWGGDDSRVIMISGPGKMAKPAPEQVLAWTKSVADEQIAPYDDRTADRPLMATAPQPGAIVATSTVDEIGVTEWTLSNGAHVVIKPTDFKNDEIRMSAFSPGGTSLVPDADFDSARFADDVVGEGGLGDFDSVELRKAMAGKVANVSAFIGELEEGLSGRASPRDLTTFMQLVHLRFTAPRKDERAFAAWKAQQLEWVRNRRLSPEQSFFEDMGSFLARDHLRRRPVTPEVIERVDLDKALEIYRDRFADAGDFTFVFVGNIDVDALRPLVETYLASLPSTGRKEQWRDVGVRPPKGARRKTVEQGSEPKSFVYLTFHGDDEWSADAANDIRMLSEVLRIRLREVMREDMGGVYFVQAFGGISRRPVQRRDFSVFFGCDPNNVDKLTKAIFDEVKAVQKKGIGDDYVSKVKQLRIRAREVDLEDNGFWARELADAYRFGDDPREIVSKFDAMVAKIDSKRIKAAARKYLKKGQYVLGVLKPEK